MPTHSAATERSSGKRYEHLKAWTACHELLLAVYRVSQSWPSTETYGLISQTRRAAFSAAANIAEGSAKRGAAEFRRFLDISLGSLSELSYAFLVARELGFITPDVWDELERSRDHANRLTSGLYWAVVKMDGHRGNGATGQ